VDLDPDLTYEIVEHPSQEGQFAMQVTKATVHGVTFVMGPAFPQVHITVDDDEEMSILASAGIACDFAVNSSAWRRWPVAPRETEFDADDAIARVAQWSGGDPAKFAQAFLYQNKDEPPNNRESYRLPIADIHNGKLTLIPRAVFSAGTILSGAHGGLEGSVPEPERIKLQQAVTEIYDKLREDYGDPRVIAPWQRGGREGATSSEAAMMSTNTFATANGLNPSALCFVNPKLTRATPIRVTEDGRVSGHLASWRKCHMGIGNRCVIAPKSKTNYAYFRLGEVLCDDGSLVKVGKITLGTGHADEKFGVIPATEHYDNTGSVVAVVNAGEDKFGVWVAGALVAGVTEDRVAELRRSPLSGDWRRVDNNLELVAALAVNSPGFPVLHSDDSGAYSLLAAGMLEDTESHHVEHEHFTSVFDGVDGFLANLARAEKAERVNAAFQDLLPVSECGCNQ
jgi:hypothetical protein